MMERVKYEYILLDVDKPEYCYNFHPNAPLILGHNPEVGVKNFFVWHTYPNISSKYNNNQFRYSVGNNWETVNIPEGMYDIDELNKFFVVLGIDARFKVNIATFKCFLELGRNVKIDLGIGDLYKILGMEQKIYNTSEEGKEIINITRGVDRILIRCNLVSRPYQKEYSDVLFDILPVGTPGGAIHENINAIEYHACKNSVIRQIEIRVTDNKNNPVKFTEHFSLKLVFKSKV
jgi:hypothetical protein